VESVGRHGELLEGLEEGGGAVTYRYQYEVKRRRPRIPVISATNRGFRRRDPPLHGPLSTLCGGGGIE
jgi:hypothetical protein